MWAANACSAERCMTGFGALWQVHCESGYYYGFPPFDHPGFKIGKFNHLLENVHPDELSRKVTDADEECLRECVAKYFPSASAFNVPKSGCIVLVLNQE